MLKKIVVIGLLLLLTLSLAACDLPFSRYSKDTKTANSQYYEGNQGVVMQFTDSGNPPSRMYYYGDADPDDNKFAIMVDVHNIGASRTRGGLYVSGYDPSMIKIDEIDIPRLSGGWGDCSVDFGFTGLEGNDITFWDMFMGNLGCSDAGLNIYTQGTDDWGFDADFAEMFGADENSWLNLLNFHYDNMNGNPSFGIHVDDNFNFDYLNHGNGMLVLLSSLSFERYNGLEYILEADSYEFPGGEMTTEVFNAEIRDWPRGLDQTERPMPFLITNCYLYTTYAAPQVCIDPAPLDEGRKVCVPRKITYNGGNGAPVAISYIEQENTRKRIYFDINIQNVGGGQVFDMGYMERCSPYYPGRLSTLQMDKVYILDARIGNQHLKCTPDRGDGVRLINGRGQVKCYYDLEYQTAKSAYETPLIIELAYGYAENMERRMTIKRAI